MTLYEAECVRAMAAGWGDDPWPELQYWQSALRGPR
jgi:hypothetical protein